MLALVWDTSNLKTGIQPISGDSELIVISINPRGAGDHLEVPFVLGYTYLDTTNTWTQHGETGHAHK